MCKGYSKAARVAFSADMFLKIKTVCLLDVIPEMLSFSMRPSKYFYDKPLPKYLDSKTDNLSSAPCMYGTVTYHNYFFSFSTFQYQYR